jgi:glycosyltransferase involved in cell wall biosynthesis
MPSTGANRWTAMTKYLRRAGHDVTILTTGAFGSRPDDDAQQVVRVADLTSSPALRRLLRRPSLPTEGGTATTEKPPPAVLTKVAVPDIYGLTWAPAAIARVRRLVADERFDAIVTTSPWESTHLVGLALGRRRPPWVADFRDSWTFEPWRPPFPTAPQNALDRALERRVIRAADRITSVHATLAEEFARRGPTPVRHVPNGWDPELPLEAPGDGPPLDPDKVSLVHTGKLIGVWGRHPRALLDGMRQLRERDPETAGRLELVLAGRLDDEEAAVLGSAGLDGMVRHVGQLPRGASAALQRRADALLILTSTRLSWEAPGKLFEYLLAERPILALAGGTEAGRIVEETGTGEVVSPDNPDAIASALTRLVDGALSRGYAPRGLERFTYPAPAELMGRELEAAAAASR